MDKKKQAAIAAVMHYLVWERQALETEAAAGPEAEAKAEESMHAAAADRGAGPWALSGRQAQMQMRTMIQMKAFHLQ